jgi:hypothetical protein
MVIAIHTSERKGSNWVAQMTPDFLLAQKGKHGKPED